MELFGRFVVIGGLAAAGGFVMGGGTSDGGGLDSAGALGFAGALFAVWQASALSRLSFAGPSLATAVDAAVADADDVAAAAFEAATRLLNCCVKACAALGSKALP